MESNRWSRLLHQAVVGLGLALATLSAHAYEEITYYHNDVAGNPIAATDQNGKVVWTETYKPYGERLKKQDAGSNAIWFHGKPNDPETGLSYFGARYYDPVTGRFVSTDPKGPDPNNIHSFNRYNYANNNPYRYTDPDGRWALPVVLGTGITIGALIFAAQSPETKKAMVRSLAQGINNALSHSESNEADTAQPTTVGANNGNAGTQTDVTKRPSRVRKGTEQANWDNAEDGPTGGKVCPTCGKEVQSRPGEKGKDWDNDHADPWRNRDLNGKDRKGVLDEYNRDTRLRCVGCNRSDNGSNITSGSGVNSEQ